MLAILSPAKSLDFDTPLAPLNVTHKSTCPDFVPESQALIKTLRKYAPQDIASLMGLSDKLADLNHQRYAEWRAEFKGPDARPAVLAFKGDVYLGLDGYTLNARDFSWAQKHVRILSGLHGLLRPLDNIRPYRLEMGTRLTTSRGSDLYAFWGDKVTQALNQALLDGKHKILVNLASNEYFKVLQPDNIQARIINVHFREWKNGKYQFVSFFAKKARGSMVRYMIDKRVKTQTALQGFDYDGYAYNAAMSTAADWVFTRN